VIGTRPKEDDPYSYEYSNGDIYRYKEGYYYETDENGDVSTIHGLSKSLMMSEQSEFDLMMHEMMTEVNNYLSPIKSMGDLSDVEKSGDSEYTRIISQYLKSNDGNTITALDDEGKPHQFTIENDTRVLDEDNAIYGSDKKLPPRELYSRRSLSRYSTVTVNYDIDKTTGKLTVNDKGAYSKTLYLYNEEDSSDTATMYTLGEIEVNHDLVENPQYIPHRHTNDDIAQDVSEKIYDVWEKNTYQLNAVDNTPTSFENFYTKMMDELNNKGNTYKTNSESIKTTADSIESSRQQVIGVNADEELSSMIKYQNAYNASSRYVNVITQMIDVLLNSMQ
jgi:flagellar hook-associated protein 1 FlgK